MIGTANAKTRVTIAVAAGAVVLLAAGFVWFRGPPQMGADEEAFKAVDALFTAVTARDEKLLGQCERHLGDLRHAGKLPPGAGDYVDHVTRMARAGRWEPAAERLYDFMLAQRRDGARHPGQGKQPALSRASHAP